jgi:hypothetical protein
VFSVAFLCLLIQEICFAGYLSIKHRMRVTSGGYDCWLNARSYVYHPTAAPVFPSWAAVFVPAADACPDLVPPVKPIDLSDPAADACLDPVHPVKPNDLYLAKLKFCTDIEYIVVSIGWDQVCAWHPSLVFDDTVAS